MAMVFIFSLSAFGFAASGTPTKYIVSLQSVKVYNGTSYISVGGTSSTVDIAAASGSLAYAGNFLSNLNIPDGTYTKVKVQPATTFTITGQTAADNRTNGSLNGSDICATKTSGDPAACTLTVDSSYVPVKEYALSPAVIVTNGIANHMVRVYFDVSNAISDEGEGIHPVQPACTVSVI